MDIGIKRRWSRFCNHTHGNSLIVPIDHGLTMGAIEGIECYRKLNRWIDSPYIDGVVVHQGLLKYLVKNKLVGSTAVCMHLNGTSNLSADICDKPLLFNVETAVRHGADAVSVDLVFNQYNSAANFTLLSKVVSEANQFGLPVLVMLNLDARCYSDKDTVSLQRQYIRSMCELGVTTVKLKKISHSSEMQRLLEDISQDIQIVFAGGERCNEEGIVELAVNSVLYGARGVCVGRNIFQHNAPDKLLSKLYKALNSNKGFKVNMSSKEKGDERIEQCIG